MKVFCLTVLGLVLVCISPLFGSPVNCNYNPSVDSLKIIEKVYLHIDRDSYFPGDDIWFKAYLVDAADRFLTDHSMNLHVELISPDLNIIDSRIVRLENGLGNGDFHLPEKLTSGRYHIRAYTNYMRNFGNQLFFNKDINIINSSDAVKTFQDTVSYSVTRPEISFFPEGGSLVDSVPSVVAFKAVDQHGLSVNVSGQIFSSAGVPVTDFSSTHRGMGIFMLDPLPGLKYYAVTKNSSGEELRYEIPGSFSTGIVLYVSRNRDHNLTIIFKTNSRTLPLINGHDLTLTVSARGNPFKSYSFRMNSPNSIFNLPTDDLPDGMSNADLIRNR